MSNLFRTKEWMTIAQLTRAWGDELAEDERDRRHYVQDLIHRLKEDIVNGHLDDAGPLHGGRRLGVRLIPPESKAGFIEGRQLLDIFNFDQTSWILNCVVVMKEVPDDHKRTHRARRARHQHLPCWNSKSAMRTWRLLPFAATPSMVTRITPLRPRPN